MLLGAVVPWVVGCADHGYQRVTRRGVETPHVGNKSTVAPLPSLDSIATPHALPRTRVTVAALPLLEFALWLSHTLLLSAASYQTRLL